MKKMISVIVVVVFVILSSVLAYKIGYKIGYEQEVKRLTTKKESTNEPNLNQNWDKPFVAMLEDGRKIGVVMQVKVESGDGLLFINYVLIRTSPGREFIGFRYEDSSKNVAYSRPIGGSVDSQMVDGQTKTSVVNPEADRLCDEVKKLLNAEALIKEYIKTNKPEGWSNQLN